jgi:hypothetical protein
MSYSSRNQCITDPLLRGSNVWFMQELGFELQRANGLTPNGVVGSQTGQQLIQIQDIMTGNTRP